MLMALLDPAHEAIWDFGRALHQQLNLPEPPPPGSPTPVYAHWFFNLNFLIQLRAPRGEPVPPPVITAGNEMRDALLQCLSVQLLPLPPRLSFTALGAWVQAAGAAVLNDNWCHPSPHTAPSPMEIVRDASPELYLTCGVAAHDSQYEVIPATRNLHKL
jgi:hypothetical protein